MIGSLRASSTSFQLHSFEIVTAVIPMANKNISNVSSTFLDKKGRSNTKPITIMSPIIIQWPSFMFVKSLRDLILHQGNNFRSGSKDCFDQKGGVLQLCFLSGK